MKSQSELEEEFKTAVKGVPAYTVALALNSITPGVDWRGCSKKDMAEEWAYNHSCAPLLVHHSSLRKATLAQLREKIKTHLEKQKKS